MRPTTSGYLRANKVFREVSHDPALFWARASEAGAKPEVESMVRRAKSGQADPVTKLYTRNGFTHVAAFAVDVSTGELTSFVLRARARHQHLLNGALEQCRAAGL